MCVLFMSEGEGLGMRLALSLVQEFTVHAYLHYNDYIAEGKSLVILYKYTCMYTVCVTFHLVMWCFATDTHRGNALSSLSHAPSSMVVVLSCGSVMSLR